MNPLLFVWLYGVLTLVDRCRGSTTSEISPPTSATNKPHRLFQDDTDGALATPEPTHIPDPNEKDESTVESTDGRKKKRGDKLDEVGADDGEGVGSDPTFLRQLVGTGTGKSELGEDDETLSQTDSGSSIFGRFAAKKHNDDMHEEDDNAEVDKPVFFKFLFGAPSATDFEEVAFDVEDGHEDEEEEEQESWLPLFRRRSAGAEKKSVTKKLSKSENASEPKSDEDQQKSSYFSRFANPRSTDDGSSDAAKGDSGERDSSESETTSSFFGRFANPLPSASKTEESDKNEKAEATESRSSLFGRATGQASPPDETNEKKESGAGSPPSFFRRLSISDDSHNEEDNEVREDDPTGETDNKSSFLRLFRPSSDTDAAGDEAIDDKIESSGEDDAIENRDSDTSASESLSPESQSRSLFGIISRPSSNSEEEKRPEPTILKIEEEEEELPAETPIMSSEDKSAYQDGNAPAPAEDESVVNPESTEEILNEDDTSEETGRRNESKSSADGESSGDTSASEEQKDNPKEDVVSSNDTSKANDSVEGEKKTRAMKTRFWRPSAQTTVPSNHGVIVMGTPTGSQFLHGQVPIQQPSQSATSHLVMELTASLVATALRLWYLTYLTRKLASQDERIRPSQRFVWERLNDRYSRDSGALARAVAAAPLGMRDAKWRRKHIRKQGRFSLPKHNLAKLYSTTVVVWDITADSKGDIDVDHLAEVVTFLIDRHTNHAFGTDKETGEALPLEVILNVKSPGGSVALYGLASAHIQRLSKVPGIETTACVDQYAASGGYMIASQAHRIIAAPFATVGSIGVIMESLNFHQLFKRYGVRPTILKSGKSKNPVSAFGENSPQDLHKETKVLNRIHTAFRNLVVSARPKLSESLDKTADGSIFLGVEALDNNLVDAVMTSSEYIALNVAAGNRVLKLHRAQHAHFRSRLGISPLDILPHMKSWFQDKIVGVTNNEKRVIKGLQLATIAGLVKQVASQLMSKPRY